MCVQTNSQRNKLTVMWGSVCGWTTGSIKESLLLNKAVHSGQAYVIWASVVGISRPITRYTYLFFGFSWEKVNWTLW